MTKRKSSFGALWHHVRGFAVGVFTAVIVLGTILLSPVLRAFLTGGMIADGVGMFMLWWAVGMLLFAAVVYVQIVVHEAGHLVCGLASGYRFLSFRVGSVMLFRDRDGLHVGRFSVAGTGGQCLLAPPSDDITSAETMPYKSYCMGGVAANLASAAVAGAVLLWCDTGVLWTYVAVVTLLTGVVLGTANGIPMCRGGVPNDGYNMRVMGRDARMRRTLWLQLEINALYSRGTLLREMPEEWFGLPAGADAANYMYAGLVGLDASRRIELRDFEGARERLDLLLRQGYRLIGLLRIEAKCEMVHAAVMLRRGRREIERLFTEETESYVRRYSHYMIGRAFTLYVWERFVGRDAAKAASEAARIRTMAARYPVRGEARACLELLEWTERLNDEEYGVD